MNEIWKILNFNENYEVSNLGNIRNIETKHILKQQKNKNGYNMVHLYSNYKRKAVYVHRVVAQIFIPNPNNLPQVNHKDGNKLNNNVNNLEWCTGSENIKHAVKSGLKVSSEKQKQAARENLKKMSLEQKEKRRKSVIESRKKSNKNNNIIAKIKYCKPLYCIELHKVFLSASRVEDKLGIKKANLLAQINRCKYFYGGYHWKVLKNKFKKN